MYTPNTLLRRMFIRQFHSAVSSSDLGLFDRERRMITNCDLFMTRTGVQNGRNVADCKAFRRVSAWYGTNLLQKKLEL